MRALTATRIGADTPRVSNRFTCNRCGVVNRVNPHRKGANGTVPDRRTYKCIDCVQVEADICPELGTDEREESA